MVKFQRIFGNSKKNRVHFGTVRAGESYAACKISQFCFRYRNTNRVKTTREARDVIPRTAAYRREFVPFIGLILFVLVVLLYYIGTTQRIAIGGKNKDVFDKAK